MGALNAIGRIEQMYSNPLQYNVPARKEVSTPSNNTTPLCHIIPPHMEKEICEKCHEKKHKKRIHVNETITKGIRTQRFGRGERKTAKRSPVAIYNAGHSERLPGRRIRAVYSTDLSVNEAWNGSVVTYNFFKTIFQRNSIDGNGMKLKSTVHYGKHYANAFWNGVQMVYGDGDDQFQKGDSRKVFDRFTIDTDIIGHELTHGVTQYTTDLEYEFQSGALNEHLSDAFGIMIKHYSQKKKALYANWDIGEKVLVDFKGKKYVLRSMKAPGTAYVDHPWLGTDPQPSTMDAYLDLGPDDDNGGVHINSGIPNHAFYLAAQQLGGYTWEKAGKIWYKTIMGKDVGPRCDFQNFAKATINATVNLYGVGSSEESAVRSAWKQTKVFM